MAKTLSDLKTEVLEELGVLGAGQAAAPEDDNAVDKRVAPVVADLAARGIVYIPDTNDIDDAVFVWLVKVMAENVAPKFGRSTDAAVLQFCERQLRRLGTSDAIIQPARAEYF